MSAPCNEWPTLQENLLLSSIDQTQRIFFREVISVGMSAQQKQVASAPSKRTYFLQRKGSMFVPPREILKTSMSVGISANQSPKDTASSQHNWRQTARVPVPS